VLDRANQDENHGAGHHGDPSSQDELRQLSILSASSSICRTISSRRSPLVGIASRLRHYPGVEVLALVIDIAQVGLNASWL
jgi:hypothetical protein